MWLDDHAYNVANRGRGSHLYLEPSVWHVWGLTALKLCGWKPLETPFDHAAAKAINSALPTNGIVIALSLWQLCANCCWLQVKLGIPGGDALRDLAMGTVPLARMGTADEAAGAILMLASPWASYITGQVLEVNGGSYT